MARPVRKRKQMSESQVTAVEFLSAARSRKSETKASAFFFLHAHCYDEREIRSHSGAMLVAAEADFSRLIFLLFARFGLSRKQKVKISYCLSVRTLKIPQQLRVDFNQL